MPINNTFKFVLQSVIAGLAAALMILLFWPELAGMERNAYRHPENGSYRAAVARAAPAVVNVYGSKVYQPQVHPLFQDPLFQRFFGTVPTPGQRRDSSQGSGVIMSTEGYILTNAHVIRDKDEIRVTLNDGRQTDAKVIGIDTDTDLAVLKTELEQLPVIPVGDSDALNVGDVVLAIGNPYDFGQTVTQGIVSAKGRKRMGITAIEDFIQTDADINPGNSGGALIISSGELVGINTAIYSTTGASQGIGLATPVNLALNVMQQIIKHGQVVRGWLGIEAQILSPDTIREAGLQQGGVLVAGVLRGGPADAAGIVPGDILLRIGDQPVSDPQQVIQMISSIKPGTTVSILILRGWEQITLQPTITSRPTMVK